MECEQITDLGFRAWFSAIAAALLCTAFMASTLCAQTTLWSSSTTPSTPSASDSSAIELGVKFESSVSGFIKGIRFYKGPANTGTHVGHLWTASGTLLGTVTFTNETATGWQEADFSTPVPITANTIYVASYHTDVGGYARDVSYFTNNTVSNSPLSAPSDGNGLYIYGPDAFPNQSYSGTNYWVDVSFTPSGAASAGSGTTLWSSSTTPSTPSASDSSAIELGVKFESSASGFIKGIRFYKGPANTGTHVGHLWTASGTLLGTVTFTNETATGWQEADFSTPVPITANTIYVASYHTDVGGYARDVSYFTNNTVSNSPLSAPSAGNGVYIYGPDAFPNQSFSGSNFWVDVSFSASQSGGATAPPPPLAIITTSLPGGSMGAPYAASVSATGGAGSYTYSVSAGALPAGLSLSSSGVISGSPVTAGSYNFTITVTDSAGDQASQAFATSILDPVSAETSTGGGLLIVTTGMHLGYLQQPYQGKLTAQGGTPPYNWQVSSGALPAGLSIDPSSGAIAGAPTASGNFSVSITVTDAAHNSASETFSLQISDLLFDAYGGFMNLTSPNGGTGHFRVEKFGNRWLFVTPAGHGFFMNGVWGVNSGYAGMAPDEMGESYYSRIIAKYGDPSFTWAPQANRRLKSWGFNTIGPYSFYLTFPTTVESAWPGGTQPVKLPFVWIENVTNYAETDSNNLAPQPTKSIYRGINTTYYPNGGDFPDVYDPNFNTYAKALMNTDIYGLLGIDNSPWLIGVMVDDTDYLFGFGPGVDFPTQPPEYTCPNLAFITLITAPTQSTNPFTHQAYSDTTVYTKLALENYLQSEYGSIQALNAAWGSNYTTFGSAGGWGIGSGLLDEDGRHTSWLGTDPYGLTNASPALKADLNGFLYQLASKYYSIMSTNLKQLAPNILYFGPSTTGGWKAPARAPILQAAGHYVDVLSTSLESSDQARLNFVEQNLGDKPLIYWEGMYANPDSGRWRYPNQTPVGSSAYAYLTQAARGQAYATDMNNWVNLASTVTGDIPSIGVLYWSWADNPGEELNWGLVSLMDNAYDGKESTISGGTPGVVGSAACADPWGFPCGAEERNYGDFIDEVRSANINALEVASGH